MQIIAVLLGVASRDKEKAFEYARFYKVPKYYGDYESLAKDPDIDIIYISTPHIFHYENTLMCLGNKKAVLCEKPFAINARQVKHMIETARKNDIFLMEALWTKCLPHINKTLDIISDGLLGDIKILAADFGFNAEYDPEWRLFNKSLGGGALLDIGIYPLFLSLLLFGKPNHIEALASIGSTGIDESIGMVLNYQDGKMAILHSSFLINLPTETEIFGTKGSLKMKSMWFMPTDLIYKKTPQKSKNIKVKYKGNGYNYEAEEAANCLLEGKKESGIIPLSFSLDLIELMDSVRQKCGIYYPGHD